MVILCDLEGAAKYPSPVKQHYNVLIMRHYAVLCCCVHFYLVKVCNEIPLTRPVSGSQMHPESGARGPVLLITQNHCETTTYLGFSETQVFFTMLTEFEIDEIYWTAS